VIEVVVLQHCHFYVKYCSLVSFEDFWLCTLPNKKPGNLDLNVY